MNSFVKWFMEYGHIVLGAMAGLMASRAYSRYKWLVISDDGSTKIIEAETIDEVVYEISEAQPRAIIKTDYR